MADDPLDELANQANRKRHEQEPTTTDTGDDTPALEEAIADAYAAIDDGEANEHLTTRDRNLSALFGGLDESGQLAALGKQAAHELERDEDPETQAETLRMLLRYAISELDDDLFSELANGLKAYEKAKAKRAAEQVSEDML